MTVGICSSDAPAIDTVVNDSVGLDSGGGEKQLVMQKGARRWAKSWRRSVQVAVLWLRLTTRAAADGSQEGRVPQFLTVRTVRVDRVRSGGHRSVAPFGNALAGETTVKVRMCLRYKAVRPQQVG